MELPLGSSMFLAERLPNTNHPGIVDSYPKG